MKDKVFSVYVSITLCTILLSFVIFFYDVSYNTRQYFSFDSYEQWTKYEVTQYDTYVEIRGTISINNLNANQLAFYSIHQNFEIYNNGYIYYRYPVINNNPLSTTPGYAWHFISFPQGINDITILITSPYKGYESRVPYFYLGNALAITSQVFNENLPTFLLCSVIFFLGFTILILWASMNKKNIGYNKLLYLGIFAMIISIWSMNESRMSILLLQNNIATSYLAFILLQSLPIPAAKFIQSFYESESKIWDIYCDIVLVQIIVVNFLQFTKIADYRQTLFSTHLIIVGLAILILGYSVKLLLNHQATKKVLIHLFCVFIYSISLILDLVAFYFGMMDNNTFGRLGLCVYFIVIGFLSIHESTDLMKKGMQTQVYEKLAYTDQMTGVYNRAAFNNVIEEANESPKDIVLVNLDINNLKMANDNFGHYNGDIYIKAVSVIIKDIFSPLGNIYRTGGDEFEVVIHNGTFYNIDKYLEKLDTEILERSWEGKKEWMNVAHGYACFDPSVDSSLIDTYKRADKMMYENKEQKKAQMN